MAAYSTHTRSYVVNFDDGNQVSFGVPDEVERTAELDGLAVALADAYQAMANAVGGFPHSTVYFSEFTSTSDSSVLAERGQVV